MYCEWQALHGTLCAHQCDDCADEDAGRHHPNWTPPALQALRERGFARVHDPRRGLSAYTPTDPQPARLAGEP